MSSSPRPCPPSVAERRRGRVTDAFTLPEVALALLVVVGGLLFVLTLAGRVRQRRNCDDYIRDVRAISAAFADYQQQHKVWPPGSSADVALPAELAATLKETSWNAGSPFGGNYGWVAPAPAGTTDHAAGPGWGARGAVTLTAFSPGFPLTLDKSDLLYIDGQIDDGDLTTGRFRTGFNGWPVYLVDAAQP